MIIPLIFDKEGIKMDSFISWIGGKKLLRKKIIEQFPEKESFGSDLESFGLGKRDMEKAKEYLQSVSKRLNQVVIENLDFQRVLKNYDKEDALFYLDPPYYETEKYYPDRFLPEDHIRLKESLDGIKGKFVLSYNDCCYVRELYKDYLIIEAERAHNLLPLKEEVKPRYKELIIKNF